MPDKREVDFTQVDPDSLSEEVRQELKKNYATQLDITYIRFSLHKLLNDWQAVSGNLQLLNENYEDIKNSFYVNINGNGAKDKTQRVHIGELIPKLYRETRKSRWRYRFKELLYENKFLVYIFSGIGATAFIVFREKILTFIIEFLQSFLNLVD